MTKRNFLKAKSAYITAKCIYKTAKENADNAERAFMERRGYGDNKYIWTADIDEATFDALCEAFIVECAKENAALRAAESELSKAERAFAEIAVSDVPLPAAKLTVFKEKINTNAAIRSKVIDLAMQLDTRTIPA